MVIVWLSALVPLTILLFINLKWSILPDIAMWPFVVRWYFCSHTVHSSLRSCWASMTLSGAVAILSGLYRTIRFYFQGM